MDTMKDTTMQHVTDAVIEEVKRAAAHPLKAPVIVRADTMLGILVRLEAAEKERDALRAKIAAMERQEPVAWCATDETGTVVEALSMNQSRRFDTPLGFLPGAKPAPSVPECPYPCGWLNLLTHAIQDGAYLARSINEDEPVTENARAVTMRTVMRLRDVLMAINNAAPEAKP